MWRALRVDWVGVVFRRDTEGAVAPARINESGTWALSKKLCCRGPASLRGSWPAVLQFRHAIWEGYRRDEGMMLS